MLAVLPEPARTIAVTAAFSGLRKSELRGLTWANYNGEQLFVERSVWNSTVSQPKTKRSRAPIPVVRPLAEALEAHRLRSGVFAAPNLPIFQAGNGSPLNLDNVARRSIIPSIEKCVKCGKPKSEHPTEGHLFELDKTLCWHGWHAFRRGLATNLHALGVDDKTIQAILRHSDISITQKIYIKSLNESQVTAMDSLSEKFATCNVLATNRQKRAN
jgi:integrase